MLPTYTCFFYKFLALLFQFRKFTCSNSLQLSKKIIATSVQKILKFCLPLSIVFWKIKKTNGSIRFGRASSHSTKESSSITYHIVQQEFRNNIKFTVHTKQDMTHELCAPIIVFAPSAANSIMFCL
jgi:hypothetical protein